MKIKGQYRQGDLLIERIEDCPPPPGSRRTLSIVLAEGEATGHHHVLRTGEEPNAADWWKEGAPERQTATIPVLDWWQEGEAQFFSVAGSAVLKHEEHGAIEFAEGVHRVTRQREYTPTEIRRVAD